METNKIIIPTERRIKPDAKAGTLDDLGFFRTPDGSFWDVDDEYFNKHGYDIHAGSYSKDFEYIPGPDWLSELGCYPEDKEKYLNPKFDEDDDEGDMECDDNADIFKGDFEDDIGDYGDDIGLGIGEDQMVSMEELEKYMKKGDIGGCANMGDINDIMKELGLDKNNEIDMSNKSGKNKNKNKKKKAKKNKKKAKEEEGWETVEEDD